MKLDDIDYFYGAANSRGGEGGRRGEGEKEREKRRKNGRRRGGGRRGEGRGGGEEGEGRRHTTQPQRGVKTGDRQKFDPVFQVECGWRKHWQRMGLYTEMAFRSAFPVELPAVKILKNYFCFVT